MASLRIIKKDVDFLISEVVSDCWMFVYLNPGKKYDEAIEVISEAVEMRNGLYEKINHPDKENLKKFYKSVNEDLLKGVDSLFLKISALAQ